MPVRLVESVSSAAVFSNISSRALLLLPAGHGQQRQRPNAFRTGATRGNSLQGQLRSLLQGHGSYSHSLNETAVTFIEATALVKRHSSRWIEAQLGATVIG